MLDLAQICGSKYEIKLVDGKVYKLNRPTQKLYEQIVAIGKLANEDANEEMIAQSMNIFTAILNRNDEGKVFTVEDVEADYDFTVAIMVVGDYMKYYADEITNRVNFQVAQ